MRGKKRCRIHGGLNPGPPLGSQNGLIHGRRTRAAERAAKERTAAACEARAKVAEAVAKADAALVAGKRRGRRKAKTTLP
jgi:hypothetical protein